MNKVARFYKVSVAQFLKDTAPEQGWPEDDVAQDFFSEMLNDVKLPARATKQSAGYDFYAPFSFMLQPGESIKIPTGIRARIEPGWFLGILPRSGLGFKYRLQLANTMGVIDADYFNAKNEGHIFIKVTNDSKTGDIVSVEEGDAFAQGIFIPFGITEDDNAEAEREGGLGSTGGTANG